MFSNWLIIFGMFILPVLLVYFKVVPKQYRLYILFFVLILAIFFSFLLDFSLIQMGIRLDNLSFVLLPYFLFTTIFVFFIYLTARFFNMQIISSWAQDPHFKILFIILSFAQEFIYRSFLLPFLGLIFNNFVVICVFGAFLFVFLHIFYYDFKYAAPLLFFTGLGFNFLFYLYPNFFVIGISHSILNFIACIYGFLSFNKLKLKDHKLPNFFDFSSKIVSAKLAYIFDLFLVLFVSFIVLSLFYLDIVEHSFLLAGVFFLVSLSLFICLYQRWSLKHLGFRTDNLFSAFPTYFIFTLVSFVFLLVFSDLSNLRVEIGIFSSLSGIIILVISQFLISFAQAFLFRSFLLNQLQEIFHLRLIAILISTIIFTLSHIIFSDFYYYWPILFLIGLGFSVVYSYRPNIILSTLSHFILNFTAISFGVLSS